MIATMPNPSAWPSGDLVAVLAQAHRVFREDWAAVSAACPELRSDRIGRLFAPLARRGISARSAPSRVYLEPHELAPLLAAAVRLRAVVAGLPVTPERAWVPLWLAAAPPRVYFDLPEDPDAQLVDWSGRSPFSGEWRRRRELSQYKHLTLLNLARTDGTLSIDFEALPELRYLDLTEHNVPAISEDVQRSPHLQTLVLRRCWSVNLTSLLDTSVLPDLRWLDLRNAGIDGETTPEVVRRVRPELEIAT